MLTLISCLTSHGIRIAHFEIRWSVRSVSQRPGRVLDGGNEHDRIPSLGQLSAGKIVAISVGALRFHNTDESDRTDPRRHHAVVREHSRHCGIGRPPNEASAFGIESRALCHNAPTPSKLVPLPLTPDCPSGLIASPLSLFAQAVTSVSTQRLSLASELPS